MNVSSETPDNEDNGGNIRAGGERGEREGVMTGEGDREGGRV